LRPRALILADDLTGAADCGVQAVRRGLRASVSLRGVARDVEVLAVDLDTREGSAAAARTRTCAAVRDVDLLYVKLDSRLRGHPGAAIDGALDGSGAEVAIVAPAFPGQGRSVPVAELRDLLRRQTTRPVRSALDLDAPGIVACDAVEDADLARIAAAGCAAGRRVVWAGSAGLAGALFDRMPAGAAALPAVDAVPGGAVLAVVGSVAAACTTQLQELLARPGCVGIAVDPGSAARAGAQARAALARGADAVLHLEPGAPRLGREHAPRIAASLAVAAAAAIGPAAGLLLTGGETARAVCDRAGVTRIDLIGEVEPGVPLGRAGNPSRVVVTKSGGFGGPDSLVAALDAIKEHCACR
jgi:4-phospho-D-threonate 3-dehydrogenase / 4-phospho-D-erythronate 3-dehydrogenase